MHPLLSHCSSTKWGEGRGGGPFFNFGQLERSTYSKGARIQWREALIRRFTVCFVCSFGDTTEMFRPVMVEPSPEYLEATWK